MKNALHFKAKAQNAKQGGIVKMKKLFTKWLSALLIAALLLPCVAVAEGEFSGGGGTNVR